MGLMGLICWLLDLATLGFKWWSGQPFEQADLPGSGAVVEAAHSDVSVA